MNEQEEESPSIVRQCVGLIVGLVIDGIAGASLFVTGTNVLTMLFA